jgi:hypothetical protein
VNFSASEEFGEFRTLRFHLAARQGLMRLAGVGPAALAHVGVAYNRAPVELVRQASIYIVMDMVE